MHLGKNNKCFYVLYLNADLARKLWSFRYSGWQRNCLQSTLSRVRITNRCNVICNQDWRENRKRSEVFETLDALHTWTYENKGTYNVM